jgi:hypothetical protein
MEGAERKPLVLERSHDDRVLLPARAGLQPGLLAGVMMAVVHVLFTIPRGVSPAEPARVVAATVLGDRALAGGWWVPVLGVLLHFAVSALLGMLFVRLVGLTARGRALGIALLYSLAVWAAAQFLVLPLVSPESSLRFGTVWPFFLAHLAFGLFLGALVPVSDEGRWDTAWSRRQGREHRPRP